MTELKNTSTISIQGYYKQKPILQDYLGLCLSWGGKNNDVSLVNTCPIDNFLTSLSMCSNEVDYALTLSGYTAPSPIIRQIINLLNTKDFISAKLLLAGSMGYKETHYLDLLGSENRLIRLLRKINLSCDAYKIDYTCIQCGQHFIRPKDIGLVSHPKNDIATSLMNKVDSQKCILQSCKGFCKADLMKSSFLGIPSILFIEIGKTGLQFKSNWLSEYLQISSSKMLLKYQLFYYSIYNSVKLHFTMNIQIRNGWFFYDGLDQEFKLTESHKKKILLRRSQKINVISYILVYVEPVL